MGDTVGNILGQGWRFILIGLFNTGFTLLIYQGLLFFISPEFSYTVAYFTGLAIMSVLHPKITFRVKQLTVSTVKSIFLYYVAIYFVGIAMLHYLGPVIGNPRLSILVVIAILIPANFLVPRFFSLGKRF